MNKGALEGMRCPICGNLDPFEITLTQRVMMFDSGMEYPSEESSADSDSECTCPECGHQGIVEDFCFPED